MINKEYVKEYIKINDELLEIKEKLKKLNSSKNNIENKLISNIKDKNLQNHQIETNNFYIDYFVKKSYQSISKKYLEDKIEEFINQKNLPDFKEELITYIYSSRKIDELSSLKLKKK